MDLGERPGEVLGEGGVERPAAGETARLKDMGETLSAQAAHPGAVIEGLGDNFTRRATALELEDIERAVFVERQEVDSGAVVCNHLSAKQHQRAEPEDLDIVSDDRFEALLLADAGGDHGARSVVFDPPEVHLEWHDWDPMAAPSPRRP